MSAAPGAGPGAERGAIPELLDTLLREIGPSGQESAPAQAWRRWCERFAAEVWGDVMGSSFARVPGTAGGPTLAVVGHIDEIGLRVTHIDSGGHLQIGGVGGWDPVVLVGQRVRVMTRGGSLRGVIGRKPIHLMKAEERKKGVELKDLHIDLGVSSPEEARELVRIGDVAVIDADPVTLRGDRIAARAMDNRLGSYVAGEAARRVAEAGGGPGDVVALAVAQEEVGLRGATTSAFSLEPGIAIAVDVTWATDQPGIELGEITEHPLGSGPVLSRGTTIHPRVFEMLYETAEQEEIAVTIESTGRTTATDADAFHISRGGVPTALISIPIRYLHSPVEVVQLSDIEAAVRLIAAFARRLEPGSSFLR